MDRRGGRKGRAAALAPRCAALALAGLSAFAAIPNASAQPAAPSLADRLCALDERQRAGPFPTDEALAGAAGQVERQLADLRRSGDASAASGLSLAIPSADGAAPSGRGVAAYCAAAGEVMRLGADGSQAQALTYLLAAFRRARALGDETLAARAAYRLALVGVADPVSGTRGASRSARRTVEPDEAESQPEAEAPTAAEAACGELGGLRLRGQAVRYVSTVALECAAERSLGTGDPLLAALANLRLSRLNGALADSPGEDRGALRGAARDRALAAISVALNVGDATERAELVGRLAEAALDYGGGDSPVLSEAIASLRADPGNARLAGIAASLEGRIALAKGDLPAARAALQSAILSESQNALPARLPTYYLLLARADPAHRATYVQAAYAALENVRPLLPRFDPLTEESSFSLYMRDTFIAAVEVQLAEARGAEETARIRDAQLIVEAYRQAELQSAFGSECVPPRAAARPEDLLPGEVILYPLLLPDRVELLYVSRNGSGEPRYRRLPPNRSLGEEQVSQLVEQAVHSLSVGGDDSWREAARRLYDLLIAPVADQLGPDSLLAIVPAGPLRALPFAALVAPDGRFLVQQTRLTLIPALAYSQPEGIRRGDRLNVIAASLQRQMNLPVGFFSELAGTGEEARIAVQYATSGRALPDFTKADLAAALDGSRIDVLHLATHAAFNGRSDRAFIVANGEVIRLAELREMIESRRTRGDLLDLIILSACETAVGDDEGSMGLAGAAVQAGARSVIGSLWQVSDVGTAELMSQFYRRYSEGRSRSEALREAQLALIDGGGDNADPGIWAAFTLLGAWR